MEWRPAGWSVCLPLLISPCTIKSSVNLSLHHKVQKFSSGTGSPGWSEKKGRKMVVVVVVPRKTDTVQQTIMQRLLDVLVVMETWHDEHEDVCIWTL